MSSDSKTGLLTVCGTLLGLSTAAVGLRLFARKKKKMVFEADDGFAVLGLITYAVANILVFILVHRKAYGYFYRDLTDEELQVASSKNSFQLVLAWDVFTNTTSGLIKLSALFFYQRVFPTQATPTWFSLGNRITIAIVTAWLLAFIIIPFLQCGSHLSAIWDGTDVEYCNAQFPTFLALVFTNTILDILILIPPIPVIASLHISVEKRLSTIAIFLMAFVGLGASIARIVIYVEAERGGLAYSIHHDLGQDQTRVVYLTMLEAGMSLFAVNLPSTWGVTAEKALRVVQSLSSLRSNESTRDLENAATYEKTAELSPLGERRIEEECSAKDSNHSRFELSG